MSRPRPRRTIRLALHASALALLGLAAAPLSAQSIPNLTRPKALAHRAVDATNAHTAAMEGDTTAHTAPSRTPARPGATVAAKPNVAASRAPAGAPPVAPAAAPAADAGASSSVAGHGEGESNLISLRREAFTYEDEGRRDPFVSLLNTNELRPMISDLKLVTILYDPAGHSVAILRDVTSKEQYRVRVGQTLGRMRVARIKPRTILFTLEEMGFSRQDSLVLNEFTRVRTP